MWGVTVKLCVFVWRWRVSAIILSAKVRIGFAAVCVTAKGHELTRSLAVEFLPRMATNLHEAMRRIGFTTNGHEFTRSLAAEFLPRRATNLHEAILYPCLEDAAPLLLH